jgi:CrcB protein
VTVLLVAFGGSLGAAARYLVDRLIATRRRGPFPLGTLVVNVTGSAALGALLGAASAHELPGGLVVWAGTGFLGAYTTFSTFAYETALLVEDGAWRQAAGNLLLSGPLSFACAGAAFLATR